MYRKEQNRIKPSLGRILWWAVRKERWFPIFDRKSRAVIVTTVNPEGFYAHEAAIELKRKVKYMNVYLKYLTETGYLRREIRPTDYVDPRIHNFKQRVYWDIRGKAKAESFARKRCEYWYVATAEGFLRAVKEFGHNAIRVHDDEKGRKFMKVVVREGRDYECKSKRRK